MIISLPANPGPCAQGGDCQLGLLLVLALLTHWYALLVLTPLPPCSVLARTRSPVEARITEFVALRSLKRFDLSQNTSLLAMPHGWGSPGWRRVAAPRESAGEGGRAVGGVGIRKEALRKQN